jgi:hypothetical protein
MAGAAVARGTTITIRTRNAQGRLFGHFQSRRLTQKEFTADPDNDGTLSKDEYLALVEKRFKAADPDNDGTVSAAEFKTAAGKSLGQLLS